MAVYAVLCEGMDFPHTLTSRAVCGSPHGETGVSDLRLRHGGLRSGGPVLETLNSF
jgi:hypothetical protein